MDNKTPLAVSANTYAIEQSIKNQTVKTKSTNPLKVQNYVSAKKLC